MTAISIGVSELLQKAEQLPPTEFETFFSSMLKINAGRKADSLSEGELELLEKINQPFSATKWARFQLLEEKRSLRTLSPDEHGELLELVKQVEKFDLNRMESVAQLAILRKVPLGDLMQSLGD